MNQAACCADETAADMEAAVAEGKYLMLRLAVTEYGIGILKIREIIGLMPVSPVPQAPAYVRGVINLRGKVVPVVDLRLRFGLHAADPSERTCIVVVETDSAGGTIPVGLLVDSVSEVLYIGEAHIQSAREFPVGIHTRDLFGIATVDGATKLLLDIDHVLNDAVTFEGLPLQ